MLHRIIDTLFGGDSTAPLTEAPGERRLMDLVVSLPVPLRGPIETRVPGVLSTAELVRRMLEGAQRSIKIFSPYVDSAFTSLAQAAKAPIQIITTLREARMKSSPVLERLAGIRPLAVRYLHEAKAKSQMFQIHAKMILADATMAYVGSANLTDTSLNYNFELGVYIEDREVIVRLHALFDYVFDFAARPAGQI